MEEKDKDKKPNMPPIPPLPGAGLPLSKKPDVPAPPPPGMIKPVPLGFPGQPFSVPVHQPAASEAARQKEAALEEAKRLKEEKEKLEKKMLEMEKTVSQEKEKALLATLKSQQDEVLSSKVEASLKDIQDKLRRDRYEQEIEQERISLKAKIKELETRLVQERETWVQTLHAQVQERESQSKDVEGHFVWRLQEMERRWLDEKAQWQRQLTVKEDEIRAFKSTVERLKDVEEELKETNLEKSMQEKEVSRLKDDILRLEKEKSSFDSYIKNLPEKERETANLRAEISVMKMKEEKSQSEFKSREDKLSSEIDRLQKEVGTIADRKEAQMKDEIRSLRSKYENTLQEKEKTLAEVSGEKVRAISELVKLKGFISRIQAVNAALEKERNNLRVDKMQMAQAMASNIEEMKKLKAALDGIRECHAAEMQELRRKYELQLDKTKADYEKEIIGEYEKKIDALRMHHQQEKVAEDKKRQDELAKVLFERQSEMENKLLEMRNKYETNLAEMRNALRNHAEQEYAEETRKLRTSLAQSMDKAADLECRINQERIERSAMEQKIIDSQRDAAEKIALVESQSAKLFEEKRAEHEKYVASLKEQNEKIQQESKKLQNACAALTSRNAEYEKYIQTQNAHLNGSLERIEELTRQAAESSRESAETNAALENLKVELKLESENRARFESEIAFLKQKLQQTEYTVSDINNQLIKEQKIAEEIQKEMDSRIKQDSQAIEEMKQEIGKYKDMEKSFAARLKWAMKKR